MSFKMFRYLDKYIGKYRVCAPVCTDTQDFPRDENDGIAESFDDLYIPCKRGVIKHTYRELRGGAILCVYFESGKTGRNVYKELKEKYPNMWMEVDDIGSFDYYIYFNELDMDKVVDMVKPKTSGKSIRPYSVKNLPKTEYTIPEEDLKKYNEAVGDMEKGQKMVFLKKIFKEFDAVIQKKKGKRYKIDEERRKSKLSNKEFVHSIGLWDELVKYIKEQKDAVQD